MAGEVDTGFLGGQGEGWYGLAHGSANKGSPRNEASSFVMLESG